MSTFLNSSACVSVSAYERFLRFASRLNDRGNQSRDVVLGSRPSEPPWGGGDDVVDSVPCADTSIVPHRRRTVVPSPVGA